MSVDPQKLGNETRSSVLPTAFPTQELLGPSYSFADELPTPNRVGVRRSNSLSSVIDAAKGAMYYVDMIGFGESSSFFTRGLGTSPVEDSSVDQKSTVIHLLGSKLSVHSCDRGTEDTHTS